MGIYVTSTALDLAKSAACTGDNNATGVLAILGWCFKYRLQKDMKIQAIEGQMCYLVTEVGFATLM